LAIPEFQAVPGGEQRCEDAWATSVDRFLDAAHADDFVGVQTYSRVRFGAAGPLSPEPGVPVLAMGYEFWPEALEATIRRAHARAGVPVFVTENGIGTTDDAQRIEYVRRALDGVVRCLCDGIDVRGYFYWSLLDNFEWLFGYGPQFGLVAVDRSTQMRTVKPSARWLGEIARRNAV
jgi:beta-glucosidase